MSPIVVIALLGVLAAVAGLVWASASIRSRLYLASLCRAQACGRAVALTFDDGPDPVRTSAVLDVLKSHGAKAAFFLVGEKVAAHPELVRRIVAEGHIVANHTYTHSGCFPLWGLRRVSDELHRTQEAIQAATLLRPRLFRPPFGVTNPPIGRAVRRAGLISVGWSIRSLDTVARTPRPRVLARILGKLHDGAVILLHDRTQGSAALVDRLLCELERRGYSIRTIEELFAIEAYEN